MISSPTKAASLRTSRYHSAEYPTAAHKKTTSTLLLSSTIMAIPDKHFLIHRTSLRRTTMTRLAIDCDFEQVEHFVCNVIPEYTQQRELINSIFSQLRGFSQRVRTSGVTNCNEDLLNAISVLQSFLSVCNELPAQTTFDVHTLIGQIKAAQRDQAGATLSFTKALWIASCSEEIPEEHTAAALHRMGQVYSQCRHYKEARNVLNKAIETYKSAGISNHHVQDARKLLEETEKKWRESPESWCTLRNSAKHRLASILE